MILQCGVEFPIVLRDSSSQMTLICPKKSNNVQAHISIDTTSISAVENNGKSLKNWGNSPEYQIQRANIAT